MWKLCRDFLIFYQRHLLFSAWRGTAGGPLLYRSTLFSSPQRQSKCHKFIYFAADGDNSSSMWPRCGWHGYICFITTWGYFCCSGCRGEHLGRIPGAVNVVRQYSVNIYIMIYIYIYIPHFQVSPLASGQGSVWSTAIVLVVSNVFYFEVMEATVLQRTFNAGLFIL